MGYDARVYNVMIASPGDVEEERKIVSEIILEWNTIHSESRNAVFLPIKWETHSSPEMGDSPQNIINRQVLEKADILVGIFWSRIGTPTANYASGSVEEIEKHITSGKTTMLYFSNKDIPQQNIIYEQLEELKRFKESCKSRGLFCDYNNPTHLKDQFRNHLHLRINDLLGKQMNADLRINSDDIRADSFPLSYEEKIMLKAVSLDDNSSVVKITGMGIQGYAIAIKSESVSINFNKSNTQRESSKWSGCLDDLVRKGLMETGGKRERYTLTGKGYAEADRIDRKLLDDFLEKEKTEEIE